MAYNPYNDVNEIYKYGNAWNSAKNKNKQDEIHKKAQQYYENLTKNGYGDTADLLSKSDSDKRKKIANTFKTFGKTPTRPYLYSLGKAKGMTDSDIDALTSYNDITGEITFGGKNIGKPDTVVDGTSYWDDTTALDNAFNDYIKRSGTTTPSGTSNAAFNQLMSSATDEENKLRSEAYKDKEDINKKYNNVFDYANQDVTGTDEYRSAFDNIMPEYRLKAMKGYQNEIADGASSNSGNIDSFAEANAARQQAALTAKGQQLAHQIGLDTYNARISNAQNILNNLGYYNDNMYSRIQSTIDGDRSAAQQYFDNEQTEKLNTDTIDNNKTARNATKASVTGYTPKEWSVQDDDVYNTYLDENGNFKKEYENIDFQSLINNAKKNGQTDLAHKLAVVRAKKALSDMNKWGQYFDKGDTAYIEPEKTEEAREFDDSMKYNYSVLEAEERQKAADNQNALDQINAQSNANIAGINAQSNANINQIREQAKYSGSVTSDGSYTYSNGVRVGDKDGKPILTLSQAKEMYKNGNTSDQVAYALNYYGEPVGGTASGADSGNVKVVTFGPIDENRADKVGMNDDDKEMYNALLKEAQSKTTDGGEPMLTEEEVVDFVVGNSDAYNMNKAELQRIFGYLGIDKSLLDNVKTVRSFWHPISGGGVKYVNNN